MMVDSKEVEREIVFIQSRNKASAYARCPARSLLAKEFCEVAVWSDRVGREDERDPREEVRELQVDCSQEGRKRVHLNHFCIGRRHRAE